MQVRTDDGRIKDVNILEVTPENFIVPKGEEDCYHCRIEVKKFNQDTGKRISKPRMQVFGKKFFESYGLSDLKRQGYSVDIIHDPNEWLKEQEAMTEEMRKQKADVEAKAKAEAKEAERKAMKEELKSELLEELKAAGFVLTKRKSKVVKDALTESEETEENEETGENGDNKEN